LTILVVNRVMDKPDVKPHKKLRFTPQLE
jgi:hypothetical protein